MARRRGFGEVERRVSRSGGVTYRARYAMPDGSRYSRTLATKMDAEAWLAGERAFIDRDAWSPPRARQEAVERRKREAVFNTVGGFAERYLSERSLRPNTVSAYRQLLDSRMPSTSARRSSSASPSLRPMNEASTMKSFSRCGMLSMMMASSSKVAGFATRLTRAVLAPRIFGGARSMSSSSSAA